MEEEYLLCSKCNKKVSTTFTPHDQFILRAWVECPECIESNTEIQEARQKVAREIFEEIESHSIIDNTRRRFMKGATEKWYQALKAREQK